MCRNCGMCVGGYKRYHPYAACMMFKSARNGDTVEANLRAVVEYGMRAQKAGISLDEAMNDIAAVYRPALSENPVRD